MRRLDRKRKKKVKDWDKHHADYIAMFRAELDEAIVKKVHIWEHPKYCPNAFNTYLGWFISRTHVELCPPAYEELMDENSEDEDDLIELRYNKAVREGNRTNFAPVMNFMVIYAHISLCHHKLSFKVDMFDFTA